MDRQGHAPLRVCVCRVEGRDARARHRAAVLGSALGRAGQGHRRANGRVQRVRSPADVIVTHAAERLAAHAWVGVRPCGVPAWRSRGHLDALAEPVSQRHVRPRGGRIVAGPCVAERQEAAVRVPGHMFGRRRFWGRGAEQQAAGGAPDAASAGPTSWSELAPASGLPERAARVSSASRDDRAPSVDDPGAARAAEDLAPSPPPSSSGPDGQPELPRASGLPVFPLLPREELLPPEELAVKLQGYGQYGCVCRLARTGCPRAAMPPKGCSTARLSPASLCSNLTTTSRVSPCCAPRRCKHYYRRARVFPSCCSHQVRSG